MSLMEDGQSAKEQKSLDFRLRGNDDKKTYDSLSP
jgi:hypothetical protein